MKHTPGPWIYSGNRVYMGAAIEKREVAVATKSDPTIRIVAEANARLIATAPTMLEVLTELTTAAGEADALQHAGLNIPPKVWAAIYQANMKARAIIAANEGGD